MSTRVTTQLDLDLAKWTLEIAQVKKDMKQMSLDAKAANIGGNLAGGGGGVDAVVGKMKGAFAGLAASAAGMFTVSALKGVVDEFDRLADLSSRLNVPVESLQRIGWQAHIAGTNLDAVVNALQRMGRQVEAGQGKAITALKELNIDATELAGLMPEEQIARLAQGFQEAQAKGQGFAQLNALFGKQFSELVPLLRMSKAELEELADIRVIDERTIQDLGKFNDGVDAMVREIKVGTVRIMGYFRDLALVTGGVFSGVDASKMWQAIDAASAAQSAGAEAKAAANRKAAEEAAKVVEETEKQERVDKINSATAEKKAKAAFEALSLEEKVEDVKRRQGEAMKEAMEAGKASDAEGIANAQSRLVDLVQEELRLKQQLAAENQAFTDMIGEETRRIEEQQQRKAEAAKREADAATKERERHAVNASDLAAEIGILKLKAAGKEKAAEAAQKELDIAKEARAIQEQLGVSAPQAKAIASEIAKLKEQADARADDEDDSGGRRKIRGANAAKREAAMEAWRASGLQAFDAAQKGPSAFDKLQKSKSQFELLQARKGGLVGDKNEQNARKQDNAMSIMEGPEIIKLLAEIVTNTGESGLID